MSSRPWIAFALATALSAGAAALVQEAGTADFDLSWHTIDCGGGPSAGDGFEIDGTTGQPDAGSTMTGGSFSLTGGFWSGAAAVPQCEGDTNSSGAVNVDDLLTVITSWGACPLPCPPNCPADIAPWPSGNCIVNVDDLLSVIVHWGTCP